MTITFAFKDTNSSLPIDCSTEADKIYINVSRDIQYRLLGWEGKEKGSPQLVECKLLKPLYAAIWEKMVDLTQPISDETIENVRKILEKECFFASREALISGEAARLFRNSNVAEKTIIIFKKLFDYELNLPLNKHCEILSKVERVLSMIQGVAIYAPLAGERFTLYGCKFSGRENPFASGIAFGSFNSSPQCWIDKVKRSSKSLLGAFENRLNWSQKHDSNGTIQEDLKLSSDTESSLKKHLERENLNKDVFDCLVYVANRLLGKRHEDERLSFRLALGTDEALRQYFTPLLGMSRLSENGEEEFFKIELFNASQRNLGKIRNNLDRLVAVIEGNYSFVQDNNLYLCLAYSEVGLQIRYLAQLNARIQRMRGVSLSRPVSRLEQVESLSKEIPQVILAFLDNDDSGYISFKERIYGIGSKLGSKRWRERSEGGWFKENMIKKINETKNKEYNTKPLKDWFVKKADSIEEWWLSPQAPSNEFKKDLTNVIELISDTPGKGATFVIGNWKDGLEHRGVKMTPVFSMVEGWKLQSINKDILYQAAIQDGATVIAKDVCRLYCRIQLSAFDTQKKKPFDPKTWSPTRNGKPLIDLWDQDGRYGWEEWGKWFKWGTRHKSSAGLAYLGKGKFCVL